MPFKSIETAALWVVVIVIFIFYLWQSYKLHKILSDEDHPHHEIAKEAMKDELYRDEWWRD